MQLDDVLSLFGELNNDKISLIYHGIIHNEFTHRIIDLFEKNIETDEEAASMKSKIVYLVGESFQNIVRHSDTKDQNNKEGIFILRHIGSYFYISSANLILNENIDLLKSKLLKINESDKEQLKELHISMMSTPGFSPKGGAGLGLIQMARRSENKLEYEFEKINDEYSNFYFQIKIKSKSEEFSDFTGISLSHAIALNSFMVRNNTYLTYKGNFSQKSVLVLLKIVERNLQINPFENSNIKSIIFSVLTELLQNISKHAYLKDNNREGVFLIGKSSDQFIISTGNYIKNSQTKILKNSIDYLNNIDKESMQKLYLDKIKNCDMDSEGNAGLGFIEIARECSDKIDYYISQINDVYSFLTISVKI